MSERDWLDDQDFYEMCQQYRHAQDAVARPGFLTAAEAFEALKEYIREHMPEPDEPLKPGFTGGEEEDRRLDDPRHNQAAGLNRKYG